MARTFKRLSARSVSSIFRPGRHADGDGLYLVVDRSGAKRWVFLTRRGGKQREIGLGGLTRVSLAAARTKADEVRRQLADGLDPIVERKRARAAASAKPTFGAFWREVVPSIVLEFRNPKHRAQWSSTLASYAAALEDRPIDEITTDEVLDVLRPIWTSKPETASRLRGRLERIFDAARTRGLRSGENPARWRGHLATVLPKRIRLARGHHAALPYQRVPAFMARLKEMDAISAQALQFCILTASRSGEVYGAAWDEVDFERQLWTVPATRMKAGRPHRVPLSDAAIQILSALSKRRASSLVFPGQKPGRSMSNMAMAMTLRRLEPSVTVHGFRSSFRDWAAEQTDVPGEIAEAALAHTIGDATERAYRRGDALEKRRVLMEAWAEFLQP